MPLESPEPWFSKTPANLPLERRQALSMIAAMDDGLGKIRAKLKAMGADQNTLIFFVSDNGAPLHPGAWDGSINTPLIGEKGMLTDGGVRVPFVAAWPGKIPAGTVYEQPVINLDIAATANALAGLPHDPQRLDGVNLMPFLLGEKKGAPHDYLYWRWRSQAAVLEFPWKLVTVGDHDRYLFDVTKPDGELAANNRLAEHPEIAERLQTKLKAWSTGLKPLGLPEANNGADDGFYADHVTKTGAPRQKAGKPGNTPAAANSSSADPAQGWQGRNATLSVKDSTLVVVSDPSATAPSTLVRIGLDLAGPATLLLHARSAEGGKASVSWRMEGEKDFAKENTVSFDLLGGENFQDVKAALPAKGKIIHLRIVLPRGSKETAIQSIELLNSAGKSQVWKY